MFQYSRYLNSIEMICCYCHSFCLCGKEERREKKSGFFYCCPVNKNSKGCSSVVTRCFNKAISCFISSIILSYDSFGTSAFVLARCLRTRCSCLELIRLPLINSYKWEPCSISSAF